jgi:hypothetical protein
VNDNTPSQIIIDGLASLLRARPLVQLERREVFRYLHTWGVNVETINKYLDQIIDRARELRGATQHNAPLLTTPLHNASLTTKEEEHETL